jgi:hypothetical protein
VEEKRTWRVRPCLGRRLLAFELEPRPELEPRDGAAALRTERTEAMTNATPVAVTWEAPHARRVRGASSRKTPGRHRVDSSETIRQAARAVWQRHDMTPS